MEGKKKKEKKTATEKRTHNSLARSLEIQIAMINPSLRIERFNHFNHVQNHFNNMVRTVML